MWQQIWNWISFSDWEYFWNRQICSLKWKECVEKWWCQEEGSGPVDVPGGLTVFGCRRTSSILSGSFLSIITGDFCSSPPSLLSSLISSQLPASLPAEAREGPAEPTRASSHGPDTLAQARSHRMRHLNVSLWTLRTWVIKLLIRNNELMNKIIDVLTLHHLWLSSCCADL